jgi:hypothetical protein
MFPSWRQGQISSTFGTSTKQVAAAILIACGPPLEVHLGVGAQHAEGFFSLQTVTCDQQQKAQAWITTHWNKKNNHIKHRDKWGASMPLFDTVEWWRFVGGFMRDKFAFGIEKKAHRKGKPVKHKLVANGFWKTHGVDVLQVGLSHRVRTQRQLKEEAATFLDVPLMHNGRSYGVLQERVRKCFRCPTSRPATRCVRQNGSEWLCSSPDTGVASTCHRDYYTPIDTGYLDVEIPNDTRADDMVIEELKDDDNEDQDEAKKLQAVQKKLESLPATHRQLLTDLGFVPGTYQVTAEQVQASWEGITNKEYLKALQMSHLVKEGNGMRKVRQEVNNLLKCFALQLQMYRPSRIPTWVITILQ